MTIRILTLALIMSVTLICFGQRTTRKSLKLKQTEVTANIDSTATTVKSIRISGYEKGQHSASESMFVTNNSDLHVKTLNITVTYLNMRGEMLHRRTENVACDLPPHETRSIDLPSWDKQRLWYYKDSQARHNEYCNPYDVKVKVNHVGY